ncbi:M3 family metallopeptidase [Pelistega europaea]|uniref:oligopeptidase A n=1 Tax=Pelistega europaea TaxID=106147 RepID=A0A7Y4L8X0_9BURK|nr:M3 family metallopeptidase [Pelistega europaea]NOL49068.1 M3 family metallopeptidase [Pelistega europaea]
MIANNPLLQPITEFVDYSAIQAEHVVPALTQLITDNKALVEEVAAQATPLNWENFIERLEIASAPLWRAWHVVNHLNSVVNTPELRAAYNEILPKITEYSTWLGLNKNLYQHYKALKTSDEYATLSPTRQRIIDLALRGFKLSGVELEGEAKERYAKISEQLANLSQKFSENTLDAVDSWGHYVNSREELAGIPEDAINAAAEAAKADGKEGYKFTLKIPSYLPVMQYAKNSALREVMYRGYSTIASDQGDKQFDNSNNIEQILALRKEEAQLLGYANFADMQLETRMADSTTQVVDFLRNLATKAKPFALRDIEEIRTFAKTKLGMESLQPWDYAYVSEQLRQDKYAYSDEEIKQYLPEDTVMAGFFAVVEKLFNITFEAIDKPTWHKDVKVYSIKEQDNTLGYLYVDLYARKGKQGGAWVDSERSRHIYSDSTILPIVYLTCNFTPPTGNKPALLSPDDLITLFHESGHALHALLSEVKEPAASPFSSVEWDAIELPSQFMENFTWEWPVMEKLTRHWETNAVLPKSLYDKMLAAKNFQSGMQTVRQVEFALFDMLIHQSLDTLSIDKVLDILNDVRQEVAVIIPPDWNRFPHNFSHLFAGGYGAGYYSYKWAEVLSADAYSLFEENKVADGSTLNSDIGALFRKHILAVGGSLPAAEFFRNFRGRDPQPDALLRHNGMLEN